MKISVIVPTYNRAHMVAATLRSILVQSHRDLEVVVVDDGSTDNTEEVVLAISAASELPVRYLKKKNGGCSSARNAGVGVSVGECIAFLDSDDQFTPDAMESLAGVIACTGADFVYSPCFEVSANGRETLHLPAAHDNPEGFAREHFLTLSVRHCSILYRREIFDSYRFAESERYNEDSDFLQKVAITFRAAYCPVPTGRVFQHGGNKSLHRKEVNLAILRSYQNILTTFPSFARSMGGLAAERVDAVRTQLAESLAAAGEFAEAERVLHDLRRKPLILTASVRLKSALPLALFRLGRRATEPVRQRCRGLLREILNRC